MRFELGQMARRAGATRRKAVTFQPVNLPAMQATNLFRAAYAPLLAVWEGTAARAADEYERTLSALQTDSVSSIEAEIEQGRVRAAAVILTIRARLRGWAMAAEAWHSIRWKRNVQAATGVDLATMIGPDDVRETLEAVIARNASLVSSVSDQARERIASAVLQGHQQRKPAREVAKELSEALAKARRRALNIAAHQNAVLAAQLNEERRRQAGIDSWSWQHSGKVHAREDHKARDGKLYSDNPDRVGTVYEGREVNAPPPADDLPGIPPGCGCTTRSVLILD